MPITFSCPHCGMATEVADEFAGQSGPCAHCGRRITVPAVSFAATIAAPVQPAAVRTSQWLIGILVGVAALVMCCLCLVTLTPYLSVGVDSAERVAKAATSRENVRKITDALLRYHADNGEFPPAYTVDANGRPLHSWRTLLLPYLGENALFQQIRLDESWDSPYNQQFHGRMPKVFADPSDPLAAQGKLTCYLAIEGLGFVFDGAKKTRLQDITDGANDTILVVEHHQSDIIWMEPRDLQAKGMNFTRGTRVPAISSGHSEGAYVGLADGSVKFVSEMMDADEFKGKLTIQGGEERTLW